MQVRSGWRIGWRVIWRAWTDRKPYDPSLHGNAAALTSSRAAQRGWPDGAQAQDALALARLDHASGHLVMSPLQFMQLLTAPVARRWLHTTG